ncbi:hypothetical protein IC235_16255 [Hymenobacter sp. BT664]|uniref:Phospholipase n=1 Tax=Hymenobacter montanus TaxID=2771359 RepID=A0A927BG48_9BACT|nr:hypothetical protein [Hymenobacter montanus]MBD2769443.1 hypothetical protein [Hymenobacter montanus]
MLSLKKLFPSRTAHRAHYYSLGQPGPRIRHVWLCLHGHQQPVQALAAQLVNLDTPERLLILPQALAPDSAAVDQALWFRPGSLGPDLALVRAYLDELVTSVLVECPAGTPLTVLGYGEGAAAAVTWLAGNRFPYERLLLYAAVFPPQLSRTRLFADLPRSPVVVIATSAAEFTPEAHGEGLLLDLRAAGLPVRLSQVESGPLTLAALGAGRESGGLRTSL